jgi:hypothetical protein
MRKIAVLLALVFIASCAQVPKEKSYPISYQEKMQASEHWRVLAEEMSSQVKLAISQQPPSSSSNFGHISPDGKQTIQIINGAVFISDADQSPFGKAMRTFLATELPKQGMVVIADPRSRYELVWEVQRVFHQADRGNDTSLLFMIADVLQAIFVGGMDQDLRKPHSEIIISYELIKNEQILQRSILRGTQVYYVNDADRDHYWDIARNEVSETHLRPVQYNITNK